MASVCCERWWASRVEVETVPVLHVCAAVLDHVGDHGCACGAIMERDFHDTPLAESTSTTLATEGSIHKETP